MENREPFKVEEAPPEEVPQFSDNHSSPSKCSLLFFT